ncbi:GH19206 [Drosophila grimshawi]|uniref:GH19206 n=2 Tax=Drosophila grimshawi TaxID=7222 RepID=B4JEY7_DROGR|nr:GH19206 [Drosophila grimshawi]
MDYGWLLFFFCCSLIDMQSITALFVTDISVPEIVDFRDNVTLSCSYDMSGHTLNSVKWYKDRLEFFRYTPLMRPVYITFPVAGIQVLDGKYFCNESTCRVDLSLLGAKSTGNFKCEVSGDAPHFKLAAKEDNMTVAALPQSDPLIEGFNSMYRMEEFLSATCASDYSSLATKLTWYINGEQPMLGELQPTIDTSIPAHDYILRRQRLQVHFYLQGHRFYLVSKILELKCVAEIENYPELRRETTLSASLTQFDNLNNQMLRHAVTNSAAFECRSCSWKRTCLVSSLFVIILLTRCSHQS